MDETEKIIEPYRIFFPLGIISAVLGMFLWLLFQNRQITFYPRQAHANIMFVAFLWSFISGFLMTALPKMTSTFKMNFVELFVMVFLIFSQLVLNIRNQIHFSVLLFSIQILTLVIFVLRRFLVKKIIPFEGFYFMPFAFIQGILGVIIFNARDGDFSSFYSLSGEALVMNLILGLGSRLIPVISRYPNALMPNISSAIHNKWRVLLLAVTLNVGFLVEIFYNKQVGEILKLLPILVLAIKYLGLFKRPVTWSAVGCGLKLGVSFLVASAALRAFGISSIASAHLLYIGSFLLITLMIATRVMLAHGEQNLEYETRSVRLILVILFLLASSFFRYFSAVDVGGILLTLAIYFCLAAIFLWSYKFVKILFNAK